MNPAKILPWAGAATDGPWLDDPAGLDLRADDTKPTDDTDRTGEQLQHRHLP